VSDIPGARPAEQVIEAAAQADRARAKGLGDENLVTLMLARRALAGQGAMPPLHYLVEAVSDPGAAAYDQVLLGRLQGHLRGRAGRSGADRGRRRIPNVVGHDARGGASPAVMGARAHSGRLQLVTTTAKRATRAAVQVLVRRIKAYLRR